MPACERCKRPLTPIEVVDPVGHGRLRPGLEHTIGEPRTSAWTGRLANRAGVLAARMCEGCHEVRWFANPG